MALTRSEAVDLYCVWRFLEVIVFPFSFSFSFLVWGARRKVLHVRAALVHMASCVAGFKIRLWDGRGAGDLLLRLVVVGVIRIGGVRWYSPPPSSSMHFLFCIIIGIV